MNAARGPQLSLGLGPLPGPTRARRRSSLPNFDMPSLHNKGMRSSDGRVRRRSSVVSSLDGLEVDESFARFAQLHMNVDKSRRYNFVGRVDDLICLGKLLADFGDSTIAQQNIQTPQIERR